MMTRGAINQERLYNHGEADTVAETSKRHAFRVDRTGTAPIY